jgi:peptide deformylase
MKEILQKENKILRKIAKEVPLSEITSTKIKKILKEMSSALSEQSDGVAIAAPQIGYSLRIFVVSGRVPSMLKNKTEPTEEDKVKKKPKDDVFINPKIIKLSKEKEYLPEGCLSVRPIYGKTYRSKKATVSAYDENGKKFIKGASGLLAQIFQHETDHLNGILFIDHAKDLREEEIT